MKNKGIEALKEYRRKVVTGEIVPKPKKTHKMKQMIRDKCKDCMNDYADGRVDCGIPACSLYPIMPYRNRKGELNFNFST